MIQVTLITNAGRTAPFMVDENTTPRQIFDERNVNYGVGRPAIDSVPFALGDMDKPLGELVDGDSCYLTCVVKADNAANAKKIGDTCVIISAIKREDLALVAKYRPEELKLYKDDNKEKGEIFAVAITDKSAGSLNKYGAVFGPTTTTEGNATITLIVDPSEENVSEMLEDKIGFAMLSLDKVEAHVPEILESIKADQAKVREHIEIL